LRALTANPESVKILEGYAARMGELGMKIRNRRLFALLCALFAFTVALGAPPASAEEALVLTYGDYEYTVNRDGTASIHAYKGLAADVTVPASLDGHPVIGIDGFAFASSSGPASIIIPEGVTSISNEAFSFDSNLITVVISDSVTSIDPGAFYCGRLKTIEVSDANRCFTSIDGVLFDKKAKALMVYPQDKDSPSYEIPTGTVTIGEGALSLCSHLTSVTIPDSISSIGAGAFTGCRLLSTIAVSENNPTYASIDNVLFDKTTNALLTYPCARNGEAYEIPSGTTAIGKSAFYSCDHLISVVIPDGVITIGSLAFADCQRMTSIAIPDSVTSISDAAFAGCDCLLSIAIPASVTSIGNYVFLGCSKLGEIVVSKDNPMYESRDGVLFAKLTKILKCSPPARSVTDYEIPWDTTVIGDSAFHGNDNLTSVEIPYGVTEIGDNAFTMCDNLTSVTIPDSVTSIGEGAFDYNKVYFRLGYGSYAETYLRENNYIA
jgi:hypothetical protein